MLVLSVPPRRRVVRRFAAPLLLTASVCLGLSGCGEEERKSSSNVKSNSAATVTSGRHEADARAPMQMDGNQQAALIPAAAIEGQPAKPTNSQLAAKALAERKIIYTASISVVVRRFEPVEQQIAGLVRKHDGYIADQQVNRVQERQQTGTWTIRVPVEKFADCVEELSRLGVTESQRIATQDVGEEFVDVESRIASKKKVETRFLEMLKDRAGALKDVIELEAKLGSVREEIERAQGRLNYLINRTSLSTIQLTLREQQDYVPPTTPEAPTFASTASDAWKSSVKSLVNFLAAIAIFCVAVTPWLPLVGVAGALILFFRDRMRPRPIKTAAETTITT